MKNYILLCLFLSLTSCASSQINQKESENLLDVYLYTRLKDEKKKVLYLSENTIENIFIVDALESVQWQSNKDSVAVINKHGFKIETAKHFRDQDVMNYYYSQLSYQSTIAENDFVSDKIVLFNWEKDKNNEKLIRKASAYLKSISKPLLSIDESYAIILERSNRNGCIIFVYKKIDGKWVEVDSITTCLI